MDAAPVLAAADPLLLSAITAVLGGGAVGGVAAWKRASTGSRLDVVQAMDVLAKRYFDEAQSANERAERAEARADAAEAKAIAASERADELELRVATLERMLHAA